MRPGSVVRAIVVAGCLLPCVTAGVLAARPDLRPRKTCEISPDEETLEPVSVERKSSALAVLRMGHRRVALVADTDAQEIVAFDARAAKVLGRAPVGGSPSHVLFGVTAGGERRLYVTQRDASAVSVFEVSSRALGCGGSLLRRVAEMKTADEPVAMAMAPDGETLYVLAGWGHALEGFSTKSHARVFGADVPREPRAVLVDAAGTRAFVSHAVGRGVTVVDLRSDAEARTIVLEGALGQLASTRDGTMEGRPPVSFGSFSFFDAPLDGAGVPFGLEIRGAGGAPTAATRTPGPRAPTQGFALASLRGSGRAERIFVPEVLVDPGDTPAASAGAPRPSGYGSTGDGFPPSFGPATAHVAVIEGAAEAPLTTSMTLVVNDTSCLLPRAAAVDAAERSLFVACLGTDEVDEYDATAPNPTAALRARWKVPSGPTGIAVDDDRLVVWSAFDRILTVIGRRVGDVAHASTVPERAASPFEVGRKLFHASGNAAISGDGRACASCHPDGRDDGLTWSSPDGPRQTPMLAGRLASSAPFGWTGASVTVREHLRQTLSRLGGHGLNDRATYALLTYVAQMKPPPRAPSSTPAKVARGGEIFRSYEAGCATCHSRGDGPTGDGEVHDVGSAARGDLTASLDTPSLQFVGGTGPYFHDGRYATLPQLLRATDGAMGSTSHLSPDDFDALTTYLESL